MRRESDFVNTNLCGTKYDRRFLLHSPHFIRFTKPRMRLRTPRLLVKVVNKRNLQRSGDAASIDATGRKKRSWKWAESGNLLPTKVGWVSCNTFCSTKSAELASSSARKINILKEPVADRLRTVATGDHQVEDKTVPERRKEATLCKSQSFKRILGIKYKNSNGETKSQENLGRSHYLFSRFSGMFRLKKRTGSRSLSSRFSGLFRLKKTGFSFRKWRITRPSSIKSFARIPSIPRGYIQIQSPKLLRRRMRKPEESEDGDEEQIELCKKRILMGEKCKPLNISGSLQYDKNGVLLPELLP